MLERDATQYEDFVMGQMVDGQPQVHGTPEIRGFFHIGVRNRHRDKTAINCYVYLEKASKLDSPTEIHLNAVELKWAGYLWPNAHIPANTARRFDACWIPHKHPSQLQFNTFSDSTEFIPYVAGEGRYELRYSVITDNFPIARGSFILSLDRRLASTSLVSTRDGLRPEPGQRRGWA